jgi:hypothetical protein
MIVFFFTYPGSAVETKFVHVYTSVLYNEPLAHKVVQSDLLRFFYHARPARATAHMRAAENIQQKRARTG